MNEGRIDFVKTVYPHLDIVIENINAIEWNMYNYTGPDILTKVFSNIFENDDEYQENSTTTTKNVIFLKTVPVYTQTYNSSDHIFYQNVNKLMIDNVSAYKSREVVITDKSPLTIHKVINHVKRMLYLLEIINIPN